ncbi:MAG: cupredoxin domain-containing protein [Candidatus Limnocylindria bacterium]
MTAHIARRATIVSLMAAGLLLAGMVAALPGRAGGAAVEIADFAFTPATLTIMVGDTVTWTNSDPMVHTATSTTGAFDSGDLAQGDAYSFTFTEAGTYDYLCTPHPTMTGTIVVEAPPHDGPASPPPGEIPNVAMPAPVAFPTGWLMAALGIGLLSGLALRVGRRSA